MYTIIGGSQAFSAESFDELAEKLMKAQSFGTYPIWYYEGDYPRGEAESEEFGIEGGWTRFDGATAPNPPGEFPGITEDEIIKYACWSLNVDSCTLVQTKR